MPPSDPKKKPAPPVDTGQASRKLITKEGVEVIVAPPPPPAPERAAEEPERRGPRAIIVPEGQSAKEFLDSLCKEAQRILEEILALRADLSEASREDMRQRVVVILLEQVREEGVPRNMRSWLKEVARKDVRNYRDLWRPPVADGVDAEGVAAAGEEEHDGTAEFDDQWAMAERFLTDLPEEEAEVVRCVYQYEMTIAETAEAVGRAPSTVFDQFQSGEKKLQAMAGTARPATAGGDEEESEES